VIGIEADPSFAAEARLNLDGVLEADVEELARRGDDAGGPYDCVVLADVLEHLVDPWAVTRWAASLLSQDGSLVVSVPNIRHVHLIAHVLFGARWPYEPTGIFDRTHLRWFARNNLPDLLAGTGLEIAVLERSYVIRLEAATRIDLLANRLARRMGDFGTLQFVFRAERPSVA
jgi:predicted TPR repeat methyltransferase